MPNRTNVPTPNGANTTSTLQVGTYNPTTDTFTSVLDLNDAVTFFIKNASLKWEPAKKQDVRTRNVRTPGERVVRWQYGNAHLKVSLSVRGANPQALANSLQTLTSAIENPPYRIRWSYPRATQYSYADVVLVTHNADLDPLYLQANAVRKVEVDFECAPFLSGDRLTLQNLAVNPGFEAPMGGGTAQTAALAFSDPLTNFNAYVVQAGGALAQDTMRYTDAVQSDTPRRYLRFGEASGTTAFEVIGGNNGTIAAGVTLGAVGAIVGSADTAYTFNGTTGKVTVPTALMPTGNQAISMECWFKFAANPASAQIFLDYGDSAHNNRAFLTFQLQTTGAVIFNCGPNFVTSAALTTGVYHHLLGTYDGTTMVFYVDGASVGTPQTPAGGLVIPGSPSLAVGSSTSSANFFSGQVDEVAFYATALSSARASAHRTAGTTTPTATANTMVIPAAGRVSFGSPAWGAMQVWQVRFRFLSGGTYSFYAHYTDASNNLQVQVTATTIALVHTVAGVAHTQATATFSIQLQTEVQFWVTFTQFPAVSGNPPYLTASLFVDTGGVFGSNYATISAAAFDAVTAEVGQPQMAASGAALGIGGAFTNVHAVFLFGPGGWLRQDSGTGTSSGAWDGSVRGDPAATTANTFPNGPVTSFGAARIDCAPAGTINASWTHYTGGTPAGSNAIPVRAAGNVLGVSAFVHSTGLGVAATQKLSVAEFDTNGTLLRTDTGWTPPSLTSNQAWPAGLTPNLTGSYTTGASCAYVGVSVVVADTNAGASANGTVWIDNVLVWNKTTTAQDSMDYHELRMPNSPAQLMVSGLQGTVPTNAWLGFGTYRSAFAPNTQLSYVLGRRASASASAAFINEVSSLFGINVMVLDATAYAGFYASNSSTLLIWSQSLTTFKVSDMAGIYHLFERSWTSEVTGNLSSAPVTGFVEVIQERLDGTALWRGDIPSVSPYAAGSTWTTSDYGQITVPPTPQGGLNDPTQTQLQLFVVDQDGTTAVNWRANYGVLMPVDGSLLVGTFNNGGGNATTYNTSWLWAYIDGLQSLIRAGAGDGGNLYGLNYSVETAALPNPALGIGGPGTLASSKTLNLNAAADPYVTLDPTAQINGVGVNQFAGLIYDGANTVQALHMELQYVPQYLYPR